MKKYWIVAKNQFLKEFFVYRYFIFAYVGGNFLELFSQLIVWMAIFKNVEIVNGYNNSQMISYIVIGWVFRFLTTNYDYEVIIAKDIKLGRLTNIIIRPVNHLKYMLAYSLGRVAVAFFVVIFQGLVWIAIFHDRLAIENSLLTFTLLLVFFVFSYIIKFFISILIGIIGFWTSEVNGISSAINILVRIFSGAFFPLDIIGEKFSDIVLSLPFAYTLYYPIQIFLGRIGISEAFRAAGIMLIWTFILWISVKILWKVGLKKYESVGI